MSTQLITIYLDRLIRLLLTRGGQARYSKSLDVWISNRLDEAEVGGVIDYVHAQLSQAKAPVRFADIVRCLDSAPNLRVEWRADDVVVRNCLEADAKVVSLEDDYWGLVSWSTRITDDMVMVLRGLGRPAHYTEMADLVNQRVDEYRRTTARAVHAQLGHRKELFVRTDPGTFALREWNREAPSQPTRYVDLIEQVLDEAGHPLSAGVVFQRVDARRRAKKSSIVMYLDLDDRFSKFSERTYGLTRWVKQDMGARMQPTAALPDDFLQELRSRALAMLGHHESEEE